MKTKESRIQILDRLSAKWSRNNPQCTAVDTFQEWLLHYDYEATLKLVYIAMYDYESQYATSQTEAKDREIEAFNKANLFLMDELKEAKRLLALAKPRTLTALYNEITNYLNKE